MAPGRAVTAKVNRPLPEMRPALAYMYADQVKNHRPCQFWGDNYPLMHGTAKWRDAPQVKKKERECEVFLRRRSRRRSALIPSFGKWSSVWALSGGCDRWRSASPACLEAECTQERHITDTHLPGFPIYGLDMSSMTDPREAWLISLFSHLSLLLSLSHSLSAQRRSGLMHKQAALPPA